MSNTERTNRLKGKVAIVTGAGSQSDDIGNGRAASILLARAGAKVVLADLNQKWAEVTHSIIESERDSQGLVNHPVSVVVVADVTNPDDCKRVVNVARETFGRLDILINNVGVDGPIGNAVNVDVDAWDNALRINVTSMMLMAKFAIPEMLRTAPKDISKGTGKAIVNLASVAGLIGGHHALLYPTSKGAVVNLTRAMAAHHGLDGIRVNAVAPGMVYTPMVRAEGMSEGLRNARMQRSLLKIEGYGWDIGNAVVFLCSDEARWVTGAILRVDAGATAGYTPGSKLGEPGIMGKL